MSDDRPRTASGEVATDVILLIFRANGMLLEAGDRLGEHLGLTAARWQVLGAVALSDRPMTVPQIARRMGLTRQSVHATIDRLVRDDLLERVPNDEHRRSQLVQLTALGRDAYRSLDRDQVAWVDALARRIPRSQLETTRKVLHELIDRLEASRAGDDSSTSSPVPARTSRR
jgi:DNA-binding MarR family transcriptional regulator